MKKTLIIKLGTDVSGASDAQIEALKEFWRVSFAATGLDVSFEVLCENEETTLASLFQRVRQEFRAYDAFPESIDKIEDRKERQQAIKGWLESPGIEVSAENKEGEERLRQFFEGGSNE